MDEKQSTYMADASAYFHMYGSIDKLMMHANLAAAQIRIGEMLHALKLNLSSPMKN